MAVALFVTILLFFHEVTASDLEDPGKVYIRVVSDPASWNALSSEVSTEVA